MLQNFGLNLFEKPSPIKNQVSRNIGKNKVVKNKKRVHSNSNFKRFYFTQRRSEKSQSPPTQTKTLQNPSTPLGKLLRQISFSSLVFLLFSA